MPSTIAWLDASSDEQRRMREVIRLFTEHDSRDELGFGQIRDALSNGLFPGTSVLLTRARYMLFVPWCYQLAEGKSDPRAAAESNERAIIGALRETENVRGLLGLRAGTALKTLPSSIYWTSLRTFGIVGEDVESAPDSLAARIGAGNTTGGSIDDDDDDDQHTGGRTWSPTLSALPVPTGFPKEIPGEFDLTNAEAGWLRDRILESVPGTLLAHLVTDGHEPDPASTAPWSDPAMHGAPPQALELVTLAHRFSLVAHGAALLYNVLLAEEQAEVRGEDPDDRVQRYRDRLAAWSTEADAFGIDRWDPDELWAWLYERAARVAPRTRQFVTEWVRVLGTADLAALAEDDAARRLVRTREKQQKGGLARLGNETRVRAWTGSSGSSALTYRWATVRDIVIDIHQGLSRSA